MIKVVSKKEDIDPVKRELEREAAQVRIINNDKYYRGS